VGIAAIATAALALGLAGGVVGGLLVRAEPSADVVCPATELAERVLPSVVTITAAGSDGQSGTGTGELVRSGGYILTNEHVIAAAAEGGHLRIRYSDGTESSAVLVGDDVPTDLAVIRADDRAEDRPLIAIGSSGDLRVGNPIVALGAPLGLTSSVTTGIVSALGRYVPIPTEDGRVRHLIDAIQTDAAINPGNSGGPLVDCSGALVGVNTAIATVPNSEGIGGGGSVGLGFAIPADIADPITDHLIESGRAGHPVLGLATQPLPAGDGASGLFVTHVVPGGPAELGGLRPGDVITEIDGEPARSPEQLVLVTLTRSAGDTIEVAFTRDGVSQSVELRLAAP